MNEANPRSLSFRASSNTLNECFISLLKFIGKYESRVSFSIVGLITQMAICMYVCMYQSSLFIVKANFIRCFSETYEVLTMTILQAQFESSQCLMLDFKEVALGNSLRLLGECSISGCLKRYRFQTLGRGDNAGYSYSLLEFL